MTRPWHALPKARAILAGCAHRPPQIIRSENRYALTSDEWRCYDPADPRVLKLKCIANHHFITAEHEGGKEAALIAIGATVDEAIDAVQDQPMLCNTSEPLELAVRNMVRAQIMGAQLERVA